jgi:hypothetical protein
MHPDLPLLCTLLACGNIQDRMGRSNPFRMGCVSVRNGIGRVALSYDVEEDSRALGVVFQVRSAALR